MGRSPYFQGKKQVDIYHAPEVQNLKSRNSFTRAVKSGSTRAMDLPFDTDFDSDFDFDRRSFTRANIDTTLPGGIKYTIGPMARTGKTGYILSEI